MPHDRLASLEAALAALQARLEARGERLVEVVRAAGQAHAEVARQEAERVRLTGLLEETRGLAAQEMARTGHLMGELLARADQFAALQQRLVAVELAVEREAARAQAAEVALARLRWRALARTGWWRMRQVVLRLGGTPAMAASAEGAATALARPEPRLEPAVADEPSAPPVAEKLPELLPMPALPPEPALPRRARRAVVTVHQLHAGPAASVPVRRSMVQIRALLRAEGFRGDAFGPQGDAAPTAGIYPAEALPRGAGHVLLIHFDGSCAALEDAVARPAAKVLMYHGERSSGVDTGPLRRLAAAAAAILAIDEPAALELRRLGIADARSCLLVGELRGGAPYAQRLGLDDCFTVLHVGRVTPAKAQDELIDAFAAFRARFGRPCRLVLVGALDPADHDYLAQLQARALVLPPGAVQFTGWVTDEELLEWYCRADLFVSMSRRQRSCLAMREAAAHGVPVLAWPAGAAAYARVPSALLLSDRAPDAVASAMLRAAGAAAPVTLEDPSRDAAVLLQALAAAGAVPPPGAATREAWAANLRLTLAGPCTGQSAAGQANRAVVAAFEAARPGAVRLLSGGDAADREMAALAARPAHDAGPELVLCGDPMLTPPAHRGDLLAALLHQSDGLDERLDPGTVARLNGSFDAVFAHFPEAAKAAIDHGVGIPVLSLPSGAGGDMAFATALGDAAAALLAAPPVDAIRVAWVTSWEVRCGIAEYSRALIQALPIDGAVALTVMADDRTAAAEGVLPAWSRGETGLERLAAAFAQAEAEAIMVQHQPGLLPWRSLARLIRLAGEQGRAILVTLHNTSDLAELSGAALADIIQTLRLADRVLVHTAADVARLRGLGVTRPVTLLAHPAGAPCPPAAARALPPTAAPVIGCTGFFLPDKGIGALIEAVHLLRPMWPGVRLRLVNAQYEHPESAAEIAACRDLAERLGAPVDWHTDFVSLAEQGRLLTGCDVIALPYQRSKESSSAALRSALITGIPVAVTPIPLFDEAEGAVFRLQGTEPPAIARGLADMLADQDGRKALAAAAQGWLADRAAAKVAACLFGMVRGVVAQHIVQSHAGDYTRS